MKTTVIYHSADYDGIFCREIARKFLPEAKLIGWNFGDPLVEVDPERCVYIVDLSPDCLAGPPPKHMVWIDHHKTSIEKWPSSIYGYRIDGVAACRLAWQWFTIYERNGLEHLPEKQDFIDRRVEEPLAVRLAGEYDIWDKRDPDAELFQHGLRSQGLESLWEILLQNPTPQENGKSGLAEITVMALLDAGKAVQYAKTHEDASICNNLTWVMEWEGLKFLCVNTARFNSLLFAAKDKPETGHDALLGFRFDGKKWMVSLYHANHRKDLDLSEIAKKHGGGGHRGACGFTCKTLPFAL